MHERYRTRLYATPREGLEPSTCGLTVRRSNQLSYQGYKVDYYTETLYLSQEGNYENQQ